MNFIIGLGLLLSQGLRGCGRLVVAKWSKLFTYSEMIKYVEKARIVITHGGPSSFIMPLQMRNVLSEMN